MWRLRRRHEHKKNYAHVPITEAIIDLKVTLPEGFSANLKRVQGQVAHRKPSFLFCVPGCFYCIVSCCVPGLELLRRGRVGGTTGTPAHPAKGWSPFAISHKNRSVNRCRVSSRSYPPT